MREEENVPVKLTTGAPAALLRVVAVAVPIALTVSACGNGSSLKQDASREADTNGSVTKVGSLDPDSSTSRSTTSEQSRADSRTSTRFGNLRSGRTGRPRGNDIRGAASGAGSSGSSSGGSGSTTGTQTTSRPDEATVPPGAAAELPTETELDTIENDLAALDQELADAQISLAQIESEP
jgi:hypothetical protein